MAIIKVNNFKGYSSQLSGITRRLDLARDCVNMVIINGQLCNLPLPRRIFITDIQNMRTIGLYYNQRYNNNILFIYDNPTGTQFKTNFSRTSFIGETGGVLNRTFIQFEWLGIDKEYFPSTFVPSDPRFTNLNFANWVQVGDWMHFIGLFHNPNDVPLNLPRMVKFKPFSLNPPANSPNNPFESTSVLLVGIAPPRQVTFSSTSAGNITGKYTFAFSISNQSVIIAGDLPDQITQFDVQESSIVVDKANTEQDLTLKNITFLVDLPFDYPGAEFQSPGEGQFVINVYTRSDAQKEFYYSGSISFNQSQIIAAQDGRPYVSVLIQSITQDLLRPQQVRTVPNPSWHMTVFKKRAYWLNAVVEIGIDKFWPINQIQYSRVIESNSGVEASYIEGVFKVGGTDQALSGAIEYLGQLIIFKERSTYVLPDSTLVTEPRVLFKGLGCISKVGGQGYIVVNGILYFLAEDGVYAWNGAGSPIKISKAINDELTVMPKIQYKYARFGHDSRYNHIYLLFPDLGDVPFGKGTTRVPGQGFIYHPDEKDEEGFGSWTSVASEKDILGSNTQLGTEGSLIQVISTKGLKLDDYSSSDEIPLVIANYTNYLYELGLIDEIADVNFNTNRWAFYLSPIFDFNDIHRLKTLKLLKVENENFATGVSGNLIAYDDGDNLSGKQFTLISDSIYLGVSFKKPTFYFIVANGVEPFRIFGYQLDVQLRGRR